MNNKRRLEIATKIVKKMLRERITFKNDIRRELPNAAKELGASVKEVAEFLEPIIKELSNEMLANLANVSKK